MAESQFGKSFNTELQNVDAKYSWINDMIRARQELVLKYMGILSVSLSRSSPSSLTNLTRTSRFPCLLSAPAQSRSAASLQSNFQPLVLAALSIASLSMPMAVS